jgi:dimethylargininase
MLRAITRAVSRNMARCELTFRGREPIDIERAARQHDEYCALLGYRGAQVTRLEADEAFPDCCFVEDTAIVLDELAVITSMGAASRRGEQATVEKELSKRRELSRIEAPATIEGGDVLRVGRKLFVGLSQRTNKAGIEALQNILHPHGYEVIPVTVKGSLHLKTACSAIDDETLLVNSHWIALEPFADFKILKVPDEEPWAAGTLRLGEGVCLEACAPRTVELVSRHTQDIEILDIAEFSKAEGSLSCLSIIFEDGETL